MQSFGVCKCIQRTTSLEDTQLDFTIMRFYLGLIWTWNFIRCGLAVDCYTCSVDFRSEPFDRNNSCLFPPKDGKGKTSCSSESKYCKGTITRINGVFVQIQRTCEADCQEFCTEKGYGIETSDCIFCCNESVPQGMSCGIQGYKSAAHKIQHGFGWLIIYSVLWLVTECTTPRNKFKLAPQ